MKSVLLVGGTCRCDTFVVPPQVVGCPKVSTVTLRQLLRETPFAALRRLRLHLRASKKGAATLPDIQPNLLLQAAVSPTPLNAPQHPSTPLNTP